jgi:hypothetical protein
MAIGVGPIGVGPLGAGDEEGEQITPMTFPGPMEDMFFDNAAKTWRFDSALTCDSLRLTAGQIYPNGQIITVLGDLIIDAGFQFASAPTTMNGCTFIVGGNLIAAGSELRKLRFGGTNATAAWYLQVAGDTATVEWADVGYSDARGGTMISALDCIDQEENYNWDFTQLYDGSILSTVKNTSGHLGRFMFLPPHGRVLEAGAEFTMQGNPAVDMLSADLANMSGQQRFDAFKQALAAGDLTVISTPNPVLYDPVRDEVMILRLSDGTLFAASPYWVPETHLRQLGTPQS